MIVYRYNAKKRTDRKFNTCGEEKNPNKIRFYAKTLDSAKPYSKVFYKDGSLNYLCELEIANIDDNINLFDMETNYNKLETYHLYVDDIINAMKKDFKYYLQKAKTKKDILLYTRLLKNLSTEKNNIVESLKMVEFQYLSDFDLQNVLIKELKTLGFDGYFTKKEITVF